jgi:hypothetical protein
MVKELIQALKKTIKRTFVKDPYKSIWSVLRNARAILYFVVAQYFCPKILQLISCEKCAITGRSVNLVTAWRRSCELCPWHFNTIIFVVHVLVSQPHLNVNFFPGQYQLQNSWQMGTSIGGILGNRCVRYGPSLYLYVNKNDKQEGYKKEQSPLWFSFAVYVSLYKLCCSAKGFRGPIQSFFRHMHTKQKTKTKTKTINKRKIPLQIMKERDIIIFFLMDRQGPKI